MHGSGTPSPWLQRWLHLLPRHGTVLDVACGGGRHLRWLAGLGYRVTGIDRDAAALQGLQDLGAELIEADIEAGPWPCAGRRFDAVVVTHYLWRPLWPALRAALSPGGVLLYETFAQGNETVGRPARPAFLLAPGELIEACAGLQVVAYEAGFLEAPARFVQRIAALAPDPAQPLPRPALAPASPG